MIEDTAGRPTQLPGSSSCRLGDGKQGQQVLQEDKAGIKGALSERQDGGMQRGGGGGGSNNS